MSAPDLVDLVAPGHTALVTQECQGGVIGSDAALAELAAMARRQLIPNVARLVVAARSRGVPVIHCVAERRPDGLGSNDNARLFAGVRKAGLDLMPGSAAAQVIPEIGVEPGDIVRTRLHGLGPMGGTDLDPVLRNLGVRTIVGVGVSLNIGMLNFLMDAVNLGYRFVMPRDAVAGIPEEYARMVLDHTVSLLASVPSTEEVLDAWGVSP